MTVAVNMSRNEQEMSKTTNTGCNNGKQGKWIRDVRSGTWQVTMFEVGK
jgi:hypothetical protein